MNQPSRSKLPTPDFLKEGNEAFLAGRFHLAAQAFSKAHRDDPRNPVPLFNFAAAKERIGDIDEAAASLTRALRLRPGWLDPAQRLSLLLARYVLPTPGELNPHGLLAAFAFDQIDQQPIAAAAIAHLQAHSALGDATRQTAEGHAMEAGRNLLLRRTEKTLTHPLLLAALARDVNHNPDFERLLTAMRRIMLLELPRARFEDKALLTFAFALLQQCLNNEHIFASQPDERARLRSMPIDWQALLSGNPLETRHLLLHLLYAPPHEVARGRLSIDDCRKLRPRLFGEILCVHLKEDETLNESAAGIPSIGAVLDSTSERVARQYEAHPYPRWTSLHMPAQGSARRAMERFFAPESLSFLDGPFRVMIAGAGTGRHSLSVAMRYGQNADVLAVDLSRKSLAYGKCKCEEFGITNLRFAAGDIRAIGPEAGMFDVIEAVGVLHHLADPFAGWRALLRHLRPGGLMAVGLYSAISRRNIAELRAETGYPGPSCDDDTARDYRASLMMRKDGGASTLLHSHDFYTLSNFRDLLLHEHEVPVTLDDIEDFMKRNGLIFRGFNLPKLTEAEFQAAFPDDVWPGALANWAAFEAQHPRTFDAMYQLWCEKR